MTRAEEVAWAAGLFEGEGCFTITRNRPRKDGSRRQIAQAVLAMADEGTVKRFHEIVGLGYRLAWKRAGHKRQTIYYTWACKGRFVIDLGNLIGAHLSPRRQNRLAEVLAAEGTYV